MRLKDNSFDTSIRAVYIGLNYRDRHTPAGQHFCDKRMVATSLIQQGRNLIGVVFGNKSNL